MKTVKLHNSLYICESTEQDLICRDSKFGKLDKQGIVAYYKDESRVVFLLDDSIGNGVEHKEVILEEPTIEEIMLVLAKGVIL